MTESLRPPVLKAITGVAPTKNSCWTIPPGSNTEGIRPKSEPLFTRDPSVKNSSGAAQKQFGYLCLKAHILCAHPAEYGSLMLAGPPTRNWTLYSNLWMMCSAISKIKWTPFWAVTLPTKENIGTESSKSPNWKYFCWSIFLAVKWSGATASNFLILSGIGIPFGKANGSGFYLRSPLKEELFKRSSLYDLDTVAHWSESMMAHLDGLTMLPDHCGSISQSFGSLWRPSRPPSLGSSQILPS